MVKTPDLTPSASGFDLRVECVQHSDGNDTRWLAEELTGAAAVYAPWSKIVEPLVRPIECTRSEAAMGTPAMQ